MYKRHAQLPCISIKVSTSFLGIKTFHNASQWRLRYADQNDCDLQIYSYNISDDPSLFRPSDMHKIQANTSLHQGKAKCVTQQDCQQILSQLLQMQKWCKQGQESATSEHIVSIRTFYQSTLQQFQCYSDKQKCCRCTSLKIRCKIQEIESCFMNRISRCNEWVVEHESETDLTHSPNSRMKQQIGSMQLLKSLLVYTVIHCSKGESFMGQLSEQVGEVSQQEVWCKDLYCYKQQRKEKVNNYVDTDDRPAAIKEECPTFIRLPNIINHIGALKGYHQEAPKPLTAHDQSSMLEDLKMITGMLDLMFDGAKCKRCRNYYYQATQYQIKRGLQGLTKAIKDNDNRVESYLCLCVYEARTVQYQSCLHEGMAKIPWQERHKGVFEPVNVEIVPIEQCSTRKEGAVLFDRLQQILNTWKELKSTITTNELRSVVKQELQEAQKLWQQYVRMPKCERCHAERSRVERELLRWSCKVLKDQTFFSELGNMEHCDRQSGQLQTLFIGKGLARVIKWCF